MKIELKVNGREISAEAAPNTLLVQFIRENLRLTGTHMGCDTAQCGACTVIADGRSITLCNVLSAQLQGDDITPIEGQATADGSLHPETAAFTDLPDQQYGFCTTGLVMPTLVPL